MLPTLRESGVPAPEQTELAAVLGLAREVADGAVVEHFFPLIVQAHDRVGGSGLVDAGEQPADDEQHTGHADDDAHRQHDHRHAEREADDHQDHAQNDRRGVFEKMPEA
jgi:hypothetical protein